MQSKWLPRAHDERRLISHCELSKCGLAATWLTGLRFGIELLEKRDEKAPACRAQLLASYLLYQPGSGW